MMPVFIILMLLVTLGRERGLNLGDSWALHGWEAVLMAVGPTLVLVLAAWLVTALAIRRVDRTGDLRSLRAAEAAADLVPWLALANHAIACLVFNWVGTVRGFIGGDLVLIDEIIAVTPPLGALAASWWIHFPVVRRIRAAILLRRFDEGGSIHPLPTRRGFVLLQFRLHVLLVLAPVLLIIGLGEVVDQFVPIDPATGGNLHLNEGASLLAALGVLLIAPLLVRRLLTVKPLPPGETRDDLLAVCAGHGVRVRDVLLWQTHGTMINGAVMGFIGPLRYVLLTDALLESLRREQVLAVMAHEIGHVRRRHMPWLALGMFACLLAPMVLLEFGIIGLARLRPVDFPGLEDVLDGISLAVGLAAAFTLFGWISRRFERQADTFAVQHLAGVRTARSAVNKGDHASAAPPSSEPIITTHAAGVMQSALEQVARLNAMNPRRRSWRHGSIRSRQRYLATLIGLPALHLPIDAQVRWTKRLTLAAFLLAVAGMILMPPRSTAPIETEAESAARVRESTARQARERLHHPFEDGSTLFHAFPQDARPRQ